MAVVSRFEKPPRNHILAIGTSRQMFRGEHPAAILVAVSTAPLLGFLIVRIASVWRVRPAAFSDTPSIPEALPPGSKECPVCHAVVAANKLYCPTCGTLVS